MLSGPVLYFISLSFVTGPEVIVRQQFWVGPRSLPQGVPMLRQTVKLIKKQISTGNSVNVRTFAVYLSISFISVSRKL